MSAVYVVLHGVGSALWIGAAWSAVAALSLAPRVAAGDALQGLARGVQALSRLVLGPGMVATTAAGLLMAFELYRIEGREAGGEAGSEGGLLLMIGTGLAAALVTIVGVLPAAARLLRYDASAEDGRALRWALARLLRTLLATAALATLALVAGVLG